MLGAFPDFSGLKEISFSFVIFQEASEKKARVP